MPFLVFMPIQKLFELKIIESCNSNSKRGVLWFIAYLYTLISRQKVFYCAITCQQELCFPSFVRVGESSTTFREML